jgi:hypothetical protein
LMKCNPGDYLCHPNDAALLLVCDGQGEWHISAICNYDPPGVAGW